MTSCVQHDCGIQNQVDNGFNNAYYAYQTDLATKLRSTSTCLGSGPGPTVSCSTYTQGNPRKTAAEIGDPVLLHRSYISSACPPNKHTAANVDTLDTPLSYTPEQMAAMNKGVGLFGYQTRSFSTASQLTEYDVSPYYLALPNRWAEGYQGYTQGIPGTNTPSRMVALCNANAKYREYANCGPSANSYGSYGTKA